MKVKVMSRKELEVEAMRLLLLLTAEQLSKVLEEVEASEDHD